MKRDNSNILIVENQVTQFEQIKDNLDIGGFTFFPNEFIDFLKIVKVAVGNYNAKMEAIQIIIEYIDNNSIDLIIMDHKIGSAYSDDDGIELAEKIREEVDVPILFLSRTKENEAKRLRNLKTFQSDTCVKGIHWEWVHKGIIGNEILEENYVKDNVIPKVKNLLVQSDNRGKLLALISEISMPYTGKVLASDFKTFFSNLQDLKKMINENTIHKKKSFDTVFSILANYKEENMKDINSKLSDFFKGE
ncbi:MAG TPA: hypothetical protein DEA82_08785 [Flavobacteriaceae bacterium]|nr:hypothetical protein [Flavobacteriaceae bacterium]HBR54266.1 hypothetical protein [Flavobacteriaceae bacterium]